MTDYSRRTWLRAACAASVSAWTLPELDSATTASNCRFGFSLYGMKSIPIAEALPACAAIGYDGVELALLPGWPTEPKRLSRGDRRDLAKLLVNSNLALLGLMENLAEPAEDAAHRANLDRLKAAAELGRALSPESPPVVETILGGKPSQWETVKDRLADRLNDWAELAATVKTIIAVKPHVGNALHTPEGGRWLIERVNSPWLKLAFDYSHFLLRGLPLERTIATLARNSVFVHVKDANGSADKFEFLLPGEGAVDYVAYFKLLQGSGWRGPIVVEVSSQISNRPGYDPLAAAKRCYKNLAPAFEASGIRRR